MSYNISHTHTHTHKHTRKKSHSDLRPINFFFSTLIQTLNYFRQFNTHNKQLQAIQEKLLLHCLRKNDNLIFRVKVLSKGIQRFKFQLNILNSVQRKLCLGKSPGILDFMTGLVNFVFNLPVWQVKLLQGIARIASFEADFL